MSKDSVNLFPLLLIDNAYHEYLKFCPVYILLNTENVRLFLSKYLNTESDSIICMDLRGSSYYTQSLLLKFLETTTLRVVLRVNESVSPTVVSRCGDVLKKPFIDSNSTYISRLLGKRSVVEKVLDLR